MQHELVVARYAETLTWLGRVPGAFRVTVYNKGDEVAGSFALPNVGREAHTYLYHIVQRYDDLADLTVFCQGRPFDHVPDMCRTLNDLASRRSRITNFRWFGFIIDQDDRTGSLLFQHWRRNTGHRSLSMETFWQALWDTPVPETFVFYPGANFAVTAKQVRRQPRAFYEEALDVSSRIPDAAHCYERCWDRVFGLAGIPPKFRGRSLPIYLRPIRRLGLTWSAVEANRRANADLPPQC